MTKTYTSPKVWKWEGQKQGRFTSINCPIAGATHEKEPTRIYCVIIRRLHGWRTR
jgi:hypothetical protein